MVKIKQIFLPSLSNIVKEHLFAKTEMKAYNFKIENGSKYNQKLLTVEQYTDICLHQSLQRSSSRVEISSDRWMVRNIR